MRVLGLETVLLLASMVSLPACFAQARQGTLDPGHSSAVIEIRSTKEPSHGFSAVAAVAGIVDVNPTDVGRSTLRLSIFPAGAQSLVGSNGKLRPGTYADLPDYTVMSFESRQAASRSDGTIAFSGPLTVAHVVRASTMDANIGYSGAQLGPPVTESTTHEVTFVVQSPTSSGAAGQSETAALAVISHESFPGLRAALLDSSWPPLVEDESCYVPQNWRDYYGALCTGKNIESPIVAGTPRYGADYPGFGSSGASSGNLISIALRLRMR